MIDFDRTLDKAVGEIGIAKAAGIDHAEAALLQARCHINDALDEVRRRNASKIEFKTPGPIPGLF